jgi:hypothetical protein
MNKLNISIFTIILLLSSCAKVEHLLFNNVRINGSLDIFAKELAKSGFAIADSTKKDEIRLNGKFLNKDCEIVVLGTNKNNVAYKVVVEFPVEGRDSLEVNFGKVQKLFSIIYGPGTSRYQQYKKRESLLYKVPQLKRDIRKGDFTRHVTKSGVVTLEVEDGYISITYLDTLNNDINKKELEEGDK